MTWIQTYRSTFDFEKLEAGCPDELVLEDIAHALSHQCRFAGHTTSFYSVAQHSVLVHRHAAGILYARAQSALSPQNVFSFAGRVLDSFGIARWALLHDASEAYVLDLPAPMKDLPGFERYREIEALIQRQIKEQWISDLTKPEEEFVKLVDLELLAMERRDLLPISPRECQTWLPDPPEVIIDPWPPDKAKAMFLHSAASCRLEGDRAA